ncbi:MAG TPA: ABC transporter substrate-binding protein [Acidimicrobiales bacterium]|nr:ABC transporter substrate-binding protein [Acidimicrobiales bacterium]
MALHGRRQAIRRWAPLVALMLLTSACGLRVSKSELQAAQQGGGGGASGQLAPGQSASNGSGGNAGAAGGGPATAGATSGGSAGGATGAAGPSSSGSNTAAAPPGGNGGPTDVGVTGDTILVGNVSDLGGPVPGLFQGGPYGTAAYFNYINSQGGIFGRKLKLISDDDGLQCSQNEADYQDLVGKVFGFVGSWSLDDNCGAQVLSGTPNVPDVSEALSPEAQALNGNINVAPFGKGATLGPFLYWKSKYPTAVAKMGTIVGNQPSAVAAWHYQMAAAESVGYHFVYEDDFPPAQNNFTPDVIKMKAEGVQGVYIISVNAPDMAEFSMAAAQQNWHPQFIASGISYFGNYIQESGGPQSVEGQYINAANARFLGEDAGAIPEVALFDKWMQQSYPNFPMDQFAANAWANAALFVQMLRQVGPHLTRAAVVNALKQVHSFNDNGMVTPADPAAKNPSNCYLLMVIHGGQYQRLEDPPAGFRCDAPYFKES